MLRSIAPAVVLQALQVGLAWGVHGELSWPRLWAFGAASIAATAAGTAFFARRSPELVAARAAPAPAATGLDRALVAAMFGLSWATWAAVGLAGDGPLSAWVAGIGLHLAGIAGVVAALVHNRHAEVFVRHQADRGHAVARSGPYRWVRHPMYAALLVQVWGACVAFPGVETLGAGALLTAVIAARTAAEDAFLVERLEGYRAYVTQTRYRLLPGLW